MRDVIFSIDFAFEANSNNLTGARRMTMPMEESEIEELYEMFSRTDSSVNNWEDMDWIKSHEALYDKLQQNAAVCLNKILAAEGPHITVSFIDVLWELADDTLKAEFNARWDSKNL